MYDEPEYTREDAVAELIAVLITLAIVLVLAPVVLPLARWQEARDRRAAGRLAREAADVTPLFV